MGMLWDLIQEHIDKQPYPPSERAIAGKLGVAPNALRYWREPKKLPSRENLEAIANLIGVRYSVVLDAALRDTGYHESARADVVSLSAAQAVRRPSVEIKAELELAEQELAEWQRLGLEGETAEAKEGEFRARVDALRAQLSASRSVTSVGRNVAKS